MLFLGGYLLGIGFWAYVRTFIKPRMSGGMLFRKANSQGSGSLNYDRMAFWL